MKNSLILCAVFCIPLFDGFPLHLLTAIPALINTRSNTTIFDLLPIYIYLIILKINVLKPIERIKNDK